MRSTVVAVLVMSALAGCRGRSSERKEVVAATIDAGCGTTPPTQTARAPAPVVASGGESAGISFQAHLAMQPFEWYVAQTKVDVVVATVEEILTTHAATNANPPRVRLRIDEVIRGDPAADRTLTRWTAPGPPDGRGNNDTGEEEYGKELQRQYEAGLAVWNSTPLCPPVVGDSFVLLGSAGKDGFAQVPERRLRATPENVALARRGLVVMEEHRKREAEREEQQRREREAAEVAWRARATPAELRRLTRKADVVVIARPYGGGVGGFAFMASRTLSGSLRGGDSLPEIPVERDVALLLWSHDRDSILFLRDTGTENIGGLPIYEKVDYGIFPADPANIKVVEAAARRR